MAETDFQTHLFIMKSPMMSERLSPPPTPSSRLCIFVQVFELCFKNKSGWFFVCLFVFNLVIVQPLAAYGHHTCVASECVLILT